MAHREEREGVFSVHALDLDAVREVTLFATRIDEAVHRQAPCSDVTVRVEGDVSCSASWTSREGLAVHRTLCTAVGVPKGIRNVRGWLSNPRREGGLSCPNVAARVWSSSTRSGRKL